MEIMTIQEIERVNDRNGKHFFEPGSTRFFRSRYPQYGYKVGNFAYFITSEQFNYDTPRFYSIRKMDLSTGNIDTVGGFQGYATRSKALSALKNLIKT